MITRSNLAEQLREYQIRSKYDWAYVSFFSNTSNVPPTRVDVLYVILELLMIAFFVFSVVSMYFWYMKLAFLLIGLMTSVFLCLKIVKHERQKKNSKRRMLLPLSM